MASVTLKNIYKSFETDIYVINDISLEIYDSEFLVLVGPSGCGKSTLLRMVAGLETPTAGEVHIGDTLVNQVPPKDRNIAMVFQNYALYPHMNVFDNLAFGLKLKRVPKPEIKERVHDAAQILDIQDLLKRKPKALSGGQRQRVALGRAIVRDPQVFLFDEPLSNLDAKLRVHMRAEIKKLHRQLGTTMIYVTHDQVEAMTMGDRIVILFDGLSQQVGTPLEVYNNPSNMFVAGFIGSPPMNLLNGRIERGKLIAQDIEIDLTDMTAIDDLDGRAITLGFRPGTIHLVDDGIPLPLIVAEPLGNETILHLKAGEDAIIAKVRGIDTANFRDIVNIKIDLEKACLFDSVTQDRIF